MRAGFPMASKGMVIGLLGGSFDPAHEGHAHISREAIKRMNLDQVWWLVTPGNPLKVRQPAPMADRIAQARAVLRGLIGDDELAARVSDLVAAFVQADLVRLFAGPRALVAGFAQTELSELRAISDELTRRHLTRSAPRRATLSEWSAGALLGEDA